jgi:primosomal replication protein N''
MIRFCPKCETERDLHELFCEGMVAGEQCHWDLTKVPPRSAGWTPPSAASAQSETAAGAQCPNGHPLEPGDLLCATCGLDVSPEIPADTAIPGQATTIHGWRLDRRLPSASQVRERYVAVRETDGHTAILTLYTEGHQPDPDVYSVLRTLPRDHVPEILHTGRWQERAFEVTEDLKGGTLADLGLFADDLTAVSAVVSEVGGALNALAECGLRHRDLRPGAIMVRGREPLDLVITSFGSARLSDFDLDLVSPLEVSRYSAPEAIAGGVAAASDWWSLGIILLEQVTRGACFANVNDQAFLIHVLTNGAPIPDGLNPSINLLLRGLLAHDRRERWCWPQVQMWLAGEQPAAPRSASRESATQSRHTITLGGRPYANPTALALAAAEASQWDEAKALLLGGALGTWTVEAGLEAAVQADIRQCANLVDVPEDHRLALALKALNSSMPLVCRGEIITPGWLLDHPEDGYTLITGPLPDILKRKDAEPWLSRLKLRSEVLRERARQLDISLNEHEFRVHLLSTSRSRLAAVWADRRRLLPDTEHSGLVALLERRQTAEEDFILLLSADVGQFRTTDAIVAETAQLATQQGIESFSVSVATAWLERPRREINLAIESRLQGFARCGHEVIDQWADQFRLERRLPIVRALLLLSTAEDAWKEPPKQAYISTLLDFFCKRVASAVLRGPLTRMLIGKTTARIDLTELHSERQPAKSLLDHLLLRSERTVNLDPEVFLNAPGLERRIRTLSSHAALYLRDTGIDGLYLGFPFLVMQEAKSTTRPRIAPVLLWPVHLKPEVGSRGRIVLGFDHKREEVRLNPAFGGLLGLDAARRWEEAARELLGRASLSAADVVEAFGELSKVQNLELVALPGKDTKVRVGEDQIVCAAALFHMAYLGQAVMEDLRQLQGIPPAGTSLETALRVAAPYEREDTKFPREVERFFTAASDPSQEKAVFEARMPAGLLVEGPPGTGKSQTIVNIVADAIGRGKTLLVICQKQAALKVVFKRLIAEGLADRIVMVNDESSDRRPIIQAVREQVERLNARRTGAELWPQQRQQTAARVEALESALDQHHEALHTADRISGLSYRLILGDLIETGVGDRAPIDVPSLRTVLRSLSVADIATLEETCGPLAGLWLPSCFENSPLRETKAFSTDSGTLGLFQSALADFVQAERSRIEIVERTSDAARVEESEPYRSWAELYAERFRSLDELARHRLARWLNLSRPSATQSSIADLLRELDAIATTLASIPALPEPFAATALVTGLRPEDLNFWWQLLESISSVPSLLQRLSPTRWLKRRRLRLFMRDNGLAEVPAFHDALRYERTLRPSRVRLVAVEETLGEPTSEVTKSAEELRNVAIALRLALANAELLIRALSEHPQEEQALATARAASRQELDSFLTRMEEGCLRQDARVTSVEALQELEQWFEDTWLAERRKAVSEDRTDFHAFAPLLDSLPTLSAYQRFRVRAAQLDDRAISVFRALRSIGSIVSSLPHEVLDSEIRRILRRESRIAWKTRLESENPALMLDPAELRSKISALAQADQDLRQLNRRLLVDGINSSRVRPTRDWEDITRLTGQRARRLREFLDRGAPLGLMNLRPVWLMNPDVASRVLPLNRGLFDTVIYDEASQIPIEYALPTLFRSKSMVVSGDEKQMPPTSFFTSKVENDEADMFEGDEAEDGASEEQRDELTEAWNRREIKDCPDLLQLAKAVLPSTTLEIHYRSAYSELIQFSNSAFYGNHLNVPVRHPETEVRRVRPIEVVRADGIYQEQSNPVEAQHVADILAKLWEVPSETRRSVGVVTFNRRQADLIEEVLEARAESTPSFREALAQERERVEEGEDMGFFVKNVENVQGDERDVIVFSSTFGRNSQGAFRRSFGVLGQTGGERRLNVAITRAREKIILVTSMPTAEISDFLATHRPAVSPRDYLQAYCEYARTISAGELDVGRSLLHRMVSERRDGRSAEHSQHDGFQTVVADYIKTLGWHPSPVGDSTIFGVDFAIEDPRTGLYGIAIECDAHRHPLLARARAREIWRPTILGRSVPAIHRVSSIGWYETAEREKARLSEAINSALRGTAA